MALSVVFLAVVGATLAAAIRYKTEADAMDANQRVAGQWSAAVRGDTVPHTIPARRPVDLIQVVDARGHVTNSSRAAPEHTPLSRVRPPPDDRFQHITECGTSQGCVILMAIRATPTSGSSVIYAGMTAPSILSTNELDIGIAVGAAPIVGLVGWTSWSMLGRTLRPVQTISARMTEITGTDLSLRVPLPPGRDEITMLARTANETLARLETAVKQQRRFASDASHELRSPLAGLRACLEEALAYPGEVDPHEALRDALATTDRLEAIVADLLELARLRAADPVPPERLDLAALAAEATGARVNAVPVRVRTSSPVPVSGQRVQLARVVENLVGNAQRHAEREVVVRVEAVDGQAVLTVEDDGDGIAPADRERVFDRFVRLDDARRRDPAGTGLGLAISREIAVAHGGTLRVEDSPHGARFVLRLRSLDGTPARPPAPGGSGT
ncbi:HAMP domain-containing sensor histidine kinase [Sphaerisporangium krabiense]|uniref:histidine kinase n=1 Tax=Sphaerisporangium krabiense TaxID=763782 RepID=A0A7W8ZC14_9ACTN|nr:HAMP domain-containing sensor histidine kinase [Sphaerisporangium krabiense]MBB5631234.1 signal transduction histidine kinase [Sphaerisporangium krabiense]